MSKLTGEFVQYVRGAVLAAAVVCMAAPLAIAAHVKTGPHGSSASGTVTRKGKTVTVSGSATGARGNTASGSGSVNKTGTGAIGSGSVTGPKGGTSSASGTSANNPNGSKTVSGTATGPRGQSKSGTKTTNPPATPPAS